MTMAQTNKYNNVNQSNHPFFLPSPQTLGWPAARGTIVPRETGVVRGEAQCDALVQIQRNIMLTGLSNVNTPTPHFYIVNMGFTRVYVFLIFALKHRLWVLIRTASMRRF